MSGNSRLLKNIMVTGGSGFIGTNFIKFLFDKNEFSGRVINVDKLTYAGIKENLEDIETKFGGKRYFFSKTDICDKDAIKKIFSKFNIDTVVHFAAESHVDRSISGPADFINTNIVGTFTLLEIAKEFWEGKSGTLFHHVSTDEVYGSLGEKGFFYESTPYDPKSPYSASKASSDHLVRAYSNTYKLPATISNCSNNYGPYQFPEKLIPLMIKNALSGNSLPIYGDGKNIRDWLFVNDHCSAIWEILLNGNDGETYNVGGNSEKTNIEVVTDICSILDEMHPLESESSNKSYSDLIKFVNDRPGHDRRYAVNCEKIKNELKWEPSVTFKDGLRSTIVWYIKKFSSASGEE